MTAAEEDEEEEDEDEDEDDGDEDEDEKEGGASKSNAASKFKSSGSACTPSRTFSRLISISLSSDIGSYPTQKFPLSSQISAVRYSRTDVRNMTASILSMVVMCVWGEGV